MTPTETAYETSGGQLQRQVYLREACCSGHEFMSPAPKKWVSSFLGTCIELHINQSKTTWLRSPILKMVYISFDEVLMLSCLVRKNCPQLSRLKLRHTGFPDNKQTHVRAVPTNVTQPWRLHVVRKVLSLFERWRITRRNMI